MNVGGVKEGCAGVPDTMLDPLYDVDELLDNSLKGESP